MSKRKGIIAEESLTADSQSQPPAPPPPLSRKQENASAPKVNHESINNSEMSLISNGIHKDKEGNSGIDGAAVAGSTETDNWSDQDYEMLRLCRNRAYAKTNSKRRQHLPASLSAYFVREWKSMYPKSNLKGKQLIQIYSRKFEPCNNVDETKIVVKKKRHWRKKQPDTIENNLAEPEPEKKKIKLDDDTHSDKQWTDSMLKNLSIIGDKINNKNNSNLKSEDLSTLIHAEWLKIYPNSTLSGRNLKSRLYVYSKTRPDPSVKNFKKWTPHMISTLIIAKNNVDIESTHPDYIYEIQEEWRKHYKGTPPSVPEEELREKLNAINDKESKAKEKAQSPPPPSPPEIPEEEEEDDIEEDDILDQGIETPLDSSTPRRGSLEQACPNHWIHLFFDGDKNVECLLTEELLQIRRDLQPKYPNDNIFLPKKPKGFAASVLHEWKTHYPNSEENSKTIAYKLWKYDKKDDEDEIKVTPKGRVIWSQAMLNNLLHTRKLAENALAEDRKSTKSHAVTKLWKMEWNKIYPDVQLEWRTIVSRYHYHFGGVDSIRSDLNNEDENKLNDSLSLTASNDPTDDSEVKGFRTWNSGMKQALIDAKHKILSNYSIDTDSKQFSRLLMEEFRKLFPKSMESTRSLLGRLQKLEKEGYTSLIDSPLKIKSEVNSSVMAEIEEEICHPVIKPIKIKTLKNKKIKEETKNEEENVELPSFSGFEDWNLSMIRDFISCMDTARRKYANLKEQDPENKQLKLVPLLLTEWKKIYPTTKETVKTFLIKIKHLKLQKEVIKKHLFIRGLLPNVENSELLESSPSTSSGKFKWDKNMIYDVIKARKIAETIYNENSAGLSFQSIWVKEFRKIHPNSNYATNNLSAHYSNWKREQGCYKKMNSESPNLKSEESSLPPSPNNETPLPNSQSKTNTNSKKLGIASNWSKVDKLQLLQVGVKVQEILQNPATPNSVKLTGFVNVLHDEWIKARPDRVEIDNIRGLNMFYSKLIKEGVGEDEEEISTLSAPLNNSASSDKSPKWTTKFSRTIRQCVSDAKTYSTDPDFRSIVTKSFRKLLPRNPFYDTDVYKKIDEVIKEREEEKVVETEKIPEPVKTEKVRICWKDPQVIEDIKESFALAQKQMKRSSTLKLAFLLHSHFIVKQPNCTLSPSTLLTRFYKICGPQTEAGKRKFGTPSPSNSRPASPLPVKTNFIKSKKGGKIILRSWTEKMIQSMLDSRELALKEHNSLGNESNFNNFLDIWYREFMILEPKCKTTKRNLDTKYKWWKERTGNGEIAVANPSPPPTVGFPSENPLHINNNVSDKSNNITGVEKIKNIPKDIFNHIKFLLEEPRIFLPNKLPKNIVTPPPLYNAASNEPQPVPPVQEPIVMTTDENGEDEDGLKLPGGAMLVAVTDKNSDMLLKPKTLEKPHVTITIGEKSDVAPDTISFPMPNCEEKATIEKVAFSPTKSKVPSIVRSRLLELGILEKDFMKLLDCYEMSRKEYIHLLKKGYLAFFPHVLECNWKEKNQHDGRCLLELIDLYIKETVKISAPDYLTRNPAKYTVTENVLKNLTGLYSLAKKEMGIKSTDEENNPKLNAMVHKIWSLHYPLIRLTVKQIMSVYHILTFEKKRVKSHFNDLEINFLVTDIYKTVSSTYGKIKDTPVSPSSRKQVNKYDKDNLSYDQMKDWLTKTENIKRKTASKINRPKLVVKNDKKWGKEKLDDLINCQKLALIKYKKRKMSLMDCIYQEWVKMYPNETLSKRIVVGKLIRQIRLNKRRKNKSVNKEVRRWNVNVYKHMVNEEKNKVTIEDMEDILESTVEEGDKLMEKDPVSSSSTVRVDYTDDENVYAYIRNSQMSRKRNVLWTADVVKDLIESRAEARKRKKNWEENAVQKYGGVGVAYSNPEIKIEKVDDMFREEWIRRQPGLSYLSMWTLAAYARKFDALKRTLIEDNRHWAAKEMKEKNAIGFYDNSSIPKYDLRELDSLTDVSQEVKDLITSRQKAKECQLNGSDEDKKLTMKYLWRREWRNLNYPPTSSHVLFSKLWGVEKNPFNMNRLKKALVRGDDNLSAVPVSDVDPVLAIFPRTQLYPEDSFILEDNNKVKLTQRVSVNTFEISFDEEEEEEKDIILHIKPESLISYPNSSVIEIPEVQIDPCEEDIIAEEKKRNKLQAKANNMSGISLPVTSLNNDDIFHCDRCGIDYHNYNNFKYHMNIHFFH